MIYFYMNQHICSYIFFSSFFRYLKEYYNTVYGVDYDIEEFAGNPIQVYLLIRRLVIDMQEIENETMKYNNLEGIQPTISGRSRLHNF